MEAAGYSFCLNCDNGRVDTACLGFVGGVCFDAIAENKARASLTEGDALESMRPTCLLIMAGEKIPLFSAFVEFVNDDFLGKSIFTGPSLGMGDWFAGFLV